MPSLPQYFSTYQKTHFYTADQGMTKSAFDISCISLSVFCRLPSFTFSWTSLFGHSTINFVKYSNDNQRRYFYEFLLTSRTYDVEEKNDSLTKRSWQRHDNFIKHIPWHVMNEYNTATKKHV